MGEKLILEGPGADDLVATGAANDNGVVAQSEMDLYERNVRRVRNNLSIDSLPSISPDVAGTPPLNSPDQTVEVRARFYSSECVRHVELAGIVA